MGLTDLLEAMERETTARAEGLLEGARREAARVRAAAEAEWERRRSEALLARETELRTTAAREIEAARWQAAARRLDARAAALDRIRRRVERGLAARADDPVLLPFIRRDLPRALAYAGEGACVAVTSPGMAAEVRRLLASTRDDVVVQVDSGTAGVVLRGTDGSWSVDGTLQSRLDRAWPRLAIDLARSLEGES